MEPTTRPSPTIGGDDKPGTSRPSGDMAAQPHEPRLSSPRAKTIPSIPLILTTTPELSIETPSSSASPVRFTGPDSVPNSRWLSASSAWTILNERSYNATLKMAEEIKRLKKENEWLNIKNEILMGVLTDLPKAFEIPDLAMKAGVGRTMDEMERQRPKEQNEENGKQD